MIVSRPAIEKEVRMRMRGKTIFILENLYLLLLGAITLLVLSFAGNDRAWETGQTLFQVLGIVQILLLVFISQAITASAITMERDQKTYDILRSTPLSPAAIVVAKLMACLSTFFVLALVSVPMVAAAFILGGVTPYQMFWGYAVTLFSLLFAGLLGLFMSTVFRRTVAAIPVSGVVLILFLIATAFIDQASSFLGMLNPVAAFLRLLKEPSVPLFSSSIPFWVPFLLFSVLLSSWFYLKCVENLKPLKKRSFIPAQAILVLILSAVMLGLFSTFNPGDAQPARIGELLHGHIAAIFLIVVFAAAYVSSGKTEPSDYLLSRRAPSERFLDLRSWLGGSPSAGTKFSYLLTLAAFAILAAGVASVQGFPGKWVSLFVCFWPFLLFTFAATLMARALSIKSRLRGRVLPRVVAMGIIGAILFGSIAASGLAHRGEIKPGVHISDALLLLNPISSFSARLTPDEFFPRYPFLKILPGAVFPAAASLIYLVAALLLFRIVERKLTRLSADKFIQPPGTESL